MQIGSTEIITPVDNPIQYDPDWRNTLAISIVDYGVPKVGYEYRECLDDPWVRKQVKYLELSRSNLSIPKYLQPFRLASVWFQGSRPSDVKFKLEPLLLSPVNFEIISLDMSGGKVDPSVFEVYEKLYFNIRDEKGYPTKSCHLRTYFAMPGELPGPSTRPEVIWKFIAANLGYEALVSIWLWVDAHGIKDKSDERMLRTMWQMAQSVLMLDIYSRRVGHTDLSFLLKAVTEQERMRRETELAGSENVELINSMLGLLKTTAPVVYSAAYDTDQLKEQTEVLQNRLLSQRNINAINLIDRGENFGIENVNQLIDNHFKNQQKLLNEVNQ